MSDYSKFWIIWSAITCAGVVAITFLATSYWKDHNAKIVDMIGSGVDPVAAMCAMQDDYGQMPVCIVLATRSTIHSADSLQSPAK